MRLFSEEVTPTFTNSNLNIIYVKDFNEVFFDVYELEINGKKYVTEKVSEYKGSPVVDIPIVYNGKEYTAPFVVQRGEFSLFFNENNSTFVKLADTDTEDNLIDVISEADGNDEVEEIILEKRESILQDIQQAKLSAKEFLNKLKQKQLKEVNEQHEQKLEQFNAELNKVREGLVEEFVKIVTNVQSDVSSQNEQTRGKLKQFIIAKVDKLTESIEDKLNNKADEIEAFLQDRVDKISNDIVTGTLATSFKSSQKLLEQQINERFGIVNSKLTEMLDSYNETNEQNIKDVLSLADDKFLTLEKATIELNDNLTKTSNKALSRIGNVKTQLEESISRNVSDIQKNISIAEERISAFYDERISNITENINTLTADNKQECLRLISESKESLLKVISEIKVDVPNIIIEQKDGKGKEIDIKKIKGDLERSITSRFTNEISSLKRMMELMSGGGSVAQQFADGGTMNGNLTVVGTISASQYLGIPVPRQDFLPLSGGVVTGNVSITGTLSATMIEALSANITVIDIKQYELSGFNVQGDATVQGSISASGTLSAGNIFSNGNRVATVVDPVRTTLTGNGILSSFAISGASGLTNPSALIVAIDGALQEPVVDYTVSGGNITFSDPLPSGSKAVVISPVNSLQVSQMIPADGSVTSSKLDSNVSFVNRPTTTDGSVASATSLITQADGDARYGVPIVRRISVAVSAFSTANVNSLETLTVPAGTYEVRGFLAVSTASTTAGAQVEIIPSNTSADFTAINQIRTSGSSLNGGAANGLSVVRVGSNLFQFAITAFVDGGPSGFAGWGTAHGTVVFSASQTITFRVRQRTTTDALNAAVLQPGSFIEFRPII
jgi:hypothetical protein